LAHIKNYEREIRGPGRHGSRGDFPLRAKAVSPLRAASLPTWVLKQGREKYNLNPQVVHRMASMEETALGFHGGEWWDMQVCNGQRERSKAKNMGYYHLYDPFKPPGSNSLRKVLTLEIPPPFFPLEFKLHSVL
jgi:hypothetical protein